MIFLKENVGYLPSKLDILLCRSPCICSDMPGNKKKKTKNKQDSNKKKTKQKTNKEQNYKQSYITVKAMASGDHQESCVSNILVLIKMHYSYYQDFLCLTKGIHWALFESKKLGSIYLTVFKRLILIIFSCK